MDGKRRGLLLGARSSGATQGVGRQQPAEELLKGLVDVLLPQERVLLEHVQQFLKAAERKVKIRLTAQGRTYINNLIELLYCQAVA